MELKKQIKLLEFTAIFLFIILLIMGWSFNQYDAKLKQRISDYEDSLYTCKANYDNLDTYLKSDSLEYRCKYCKKYGKALVK